MDTDSEALELKRFISKLEAHPEEIESNKEWDPQIISLKTALSTIFSELISPVLMDFGCGKGTLIPLLQEMPDFVKKKGVYIGINAPEIGENLSSKFVLSGFYKNPGSLLLNYNDFKDNDFKEEEIRPCNVIVIKNASSTGKSRAQ